MEQTLEDANDSTEKSSSLKNSDISYLFNCLSQQQISDENNLIYNFKMQFDKTIFLLDESIRNFVKYRHDKEINLTINKIFPLYSLANIVNDTDLIELINKYICEHSEEFIDKLYFLITSYSYIQTYYYEKFISEHLLDYVQYEKLALFPLSILNRILTKYQLGNNSLEKQEIVDFLFNVLLKKGKDASFLFTKIGSLMKNKEILTRLVSDEYSPFFNFHLIDESFTDTMYNNQGTLIKEILALKVQQTDVINTIKNEQENEMKNLEDEINQLKKDKLLFVTNEQRENDLEIIRKEMKEIKDNMSLFVTNEQRENDLEIIRKEMNEFKESMSLFITKEQHNDEVNKLKDEINELKEEKTKLQELQTKKFDRLKKVVFESSKCTGLNDNLEVFNSLSGEAQNFIFSGLMSGRDCSQINEKIGSLLFFLSNEAQNSKSDKEMKDSYVYICSKQKLESLSKLNEIESIDIKSNIISVLHENGSLESDEFIEKINKFEDKISIEYQYPLQDKTVFESIKRVKQTKCQKLKISFIVSGIERTTKDFQREEVIDKITIDTSVKIISGGLNEGSFEYCTNVTELILPNTVTLIGGGAFNALRNLKELTIPPSVEKIEGGAFSECILLNEIVFPPQLKEVHSDAFKRCRNLKRIVIDPYNTKILPNAFPECPNLKHFTFHPSIKELKKLDLNNTSLNDIRELVIPETVTSIASDTFSTCTNLYKVTILPSMKTVGHIGADHLQCIEINPYQTNIDNFVAPALNHFVFHSSVTHISRIELPFFKNIKKITIPNTVTSISPAAFYDYSNLEEIEIPNSIEIIEHDTFKNCKKLNKVAIASSVKKIHGGVFCQCTSLEEITIPGSVVFIGGGAFSYCSSLKKVTLPDSLKTIENDLFIHCRALYQVNIPTSLRSIGRNAFDVCQKLEDITIPKSLTTIGYKSFVGMSIRKIVIPNTVIYIEEKAFCGCQNLSEVKFAENSKLSRIGKEAFYHCHLLKSITIPNSVKFIGEGAFRNCSNLAIVILPLHLESIENDVFNQCTSLKIINIEDCYYIKTIGGGAFNGCAFTEIIIPYDVKSIGGGAFYSCEKLSKIQIPYDLSTINEYAFKGCESLGEINLYNISYLGKGVFEGCESLEKCNIYRPEITKIEPFTFKKCYHLNDLYINASIISIGEDALYGCPTPIRLNTSFKSIGRLAFHGCLLKTIKIPTSVTSIDERAFELCISLTQINIPKSVRKIGKEAFKSCDSLKRVTFDPDSSLNEIENYAFDSCKSLEYVQIPSSVTLICQYAFCQCEKLQHVQFVIPSSLKEIGDGAFKKCSSLSEIKLPSSLRKVGNYAFSYCGKLEPFEFPSNVSVGDDIFEEDILFDELLEIFKKSF